jgi:hypothetical protein
MPALLDKLKSKLGDRSEEEILDEIQQVRKARGKFDRSTGQLAANAHGQVDAYVEQARQRLAGVLTNGIPGSTFDPMSAEIAKLAILASEDFEARARAAIDGSASLSKMPITDYEKKLAGFDRAESELKLELQRRQAQAEVDEASGGLQAIEDAARRLEAKP